MSREPGRPGGTYLAGWLFADLLLVIVLVVLGSEVPAAAPDPHPSPTATATAAPDPSHSPSPTPSDTARPGGLDPVTVSVGVRLDPDALIAGRPSETAALTRQVNEEIKRYEGRTAAFVMVFGTVRSGGAVDTGRSDAYATAVARQLPQAAPRFFPPYSEKIIRGYHDSGQAIPSGTARIELFFLLS
ncbi:hypothetical protein [Streptomyces sp. A0592]|uniref:hypothetical protein n=1 Tax=Streptomyces sp. A0592 TaxID=2563099 RepID=UPI00109ED707|nr:hypothetical protein [Streptomyces sp. A0592]THA74360.1 hypothetical protein E6U81_38065 [Streptomyces sp. A0592]